MTDFSRMSYELSKARDERVKLQAFLNTVGPCSGTNHEEVREWIQGIDYAREYSDINEEEFITNVLALSRDPLRTIIDFELKKKKAQTPPAEPKWNDIKQHIINECLSTDEKDLMRDRVESTRQGAIEDIRGYILRFKELIRKAYSKEEQQGIVLERLIRTFIRGFTNQTIRERIILENPKTIEEVGELAVKSARALHLASANRPSSTPFSTMDTDERNIEPMDMTNSRQHKRVQFKDRDMRRHNYTHTSNDSFKSPSRSPKTSRSPNQRANSPKHTQSPHVSSIDPKNTTCFYCNMPGHTENRCPSRGTLTCQYCKSEGHIENQCFKKARETATSSTLHCNFCGKNNHVFENCFSRLRVENRCFLCHKVGHQRKFCRSNGNEKPSARPRTFPRKNIQEERSKPQYPGWKQPHRQANSVNYQTAERFNREGLNRTNRNPTERQKLVNDVSDFHSRTPNPSHQ